MKLVLKDPTNCPHCGKIASGHMSIKNNFGLRNMGDGTVRVQSWCRKCRSRTGVAI